MNNMMTAVTTVLSKYVTFTGRASRPEFWWWVLAVLIALIVASLLDGAVVAPILGFGAFPEDAIEPLSTILSLALLLPNIAVAVRRLHDTGRSGWWLLLAFIPILGTLVLLYFYIQPSENGANRFGPPEPFGQQ